MNKSELQVALEKLVIKEAIYRTERLINSLGPNPEKDFEYKRHLAAIEVKKEMLEKEWVENLVDHEVHLNGYYSNSAARMIANLKAFPFTSLNKEVNTRELSELIYVNENSVKVLWLTTLVEDVVVNKGVKLPDEDLVKLQEGVNLDSEGIVNLLVVTLRGLEKDSYLEYHRCVEHLFGDV